MRTNFFLGLFTLPTKRCEMIRMTKHKKNHRSLSISMHYLNMNTYSLRHPAQLCKGEEQTTLYFKIQFKVGRGQ